MTLEAGQADSYAQNTTCVSDAITTSDKSFQLPKGGIEVTSVTVVELSLYSMGTLDT